MANTASYDQVIAFLRAHGQQPTGNQALDYRLAQGLQDQEQAANHPEVAALIRSGGSGHVNNAFGDADVDVEHGRVTNVTRGSQKRAIALTAATAGGIFGGGAALGAFGAGGGAGAGGAGSYIGADVAGTAGAAGGGSAMASAAPWLSRGLQVAAPIIGSALSNRGNTGNQPLQDPELLAQQRQLLEYGNRRLAQAEPVHQAAMQMAMRMAPTGTSPRMQQAVQSSMAPRPQPPINPQVLEALQRLMGGVR